MLDSSEAILSFIKNKTREQLDTDRLLASGIIRELEILGEAANHVSKDTQKSFPEIPWKQLISMRNTLIHAYFDVDYDIVWKTINDDLPPFYHQIKKIIADLETKIYEKAQS